MIGHYTFGVTEHGLIVRVQHNADDNPQTVILTRKEWGIMKRRIDHRFEKVKSQKKITLRFS